MESLIPIPGRYPSNVNKFSLYKRLGSSIGHIDKMRRHYKKFSYNNGIELDI
jgi:hypothetical protein